MPQNKPKWTNTQLDKNIRVTTFVKAHPRLIATMIDNTLETANSPIAFNQLSKPAQNTLIRSTGELALEYFENYGAFDSKREIQKHGAEEHIRQQQLLEKLQEQQAATNQAMADQTAAVNQVITTKEENLEHQIDLNGLIQILNDETVAEQVILDSQLTESELIAAENNEATSVTEIDAINEGPSLYKGPSPSERIEEKLEEEFQTDSSNSEQNSSITDNIKTFLNHESIKEDIQFSNKIENRQGPSAVPTPKPQD